MLRLSVLIAGLLVIGCTALDDDDRVTDDDDSSDDDDSARR